MEVKSEEQIKRRLGDLLDDTEVILLMIAVEARHLMPTDRVFRTTRQLFSNLSALRDEFEVYRLLSQIPTSCSSDASAEDDEHSHETGDTAR